MEIKQEYIDKLNKLSPKEKQLAVSILTEFSKTGKSELFNKLKFDVDYSDYEEIPVDIDTFLCDDNYMGFAWKDETGKLKIYPYWMKVLRDLFPNNVDTKVNTFIASGARGLGKSEISIAIMCYLLYRVMCLKNPLEHFHLKPTEKIVFALMNIKLALVEEIATSKFQNSIKLSPWFMKRGHITGKSNLVWEPDDKYNIDIKIGSQSDDLIGLPIFFCLDGDTIISTINGNYKIKDLVNKSIRVPTINNDNEIVVSDECTVKMTGIYNEEYQIELEDGTILKCTPNHKFMLKDGTYKEAKDLTEDDELMDTKPFGYIYKFTNLKDPSIGYNIHKGGQGGNSLNDTKKWPELHTGNKNGRYGKEVSINTRLKISKANKGKYTLGNNPNSKCVICIDTGEVFTSIKEATLKYPKATHISDCCKNIIKSSGKLHWRYKDEN